LFIVLIFIGKSLIILRGGSHVEDLGVAERIIIQTALQETGRELGNALWVL
jgi:hypothetical protein